MCALKVYSYKSVKESLYDILSRPGILDKCEEWRARNVPVGSMFDACDGKVWSDFMICNGRNFLVEKSNHEIVAWFQPFKWTELCWYDLLQNLPRSMCYKIENIIIVGIIPRPKEPSSNSYLSPLLYLTCGINELMFQVIKAFKLYVLLYWAKPFVMK